MLLLNTGAVLMGGAVRCWGIMKIGQLGYKRDISDDLDFSIGGDEDPASAGDVNVGGSVTQIAAGGSHNCAVLMGGAVRCWGRNDHGQLGYGHDRSSDDIDAGDMDVADAGDVEVGGIVRQIATGREHTCALLSTGNLRCWGANFSYGQLGYGHYILIGNNEKPASAGDVHIGGSVIQLWR